MTKFSTLKSALSEFRRRGDDRWAAKDEVPTTEDVGALVDEKVAEAVKDIEVPVEELTDADMDEIFSAMSDESGEPDGE